MRYFIFSLCVLVNYSLLAQIVQEENLEMLIFESGKQYGVVPAGSNGIVIFNETKNSESVSKRKWEIIHIDTLLTPVWNSYLESDNNFKITHVKYYNGFIYLLFQDMNTPMKSAFFVRGSILNEKFNFFELKDFLPKKIVGFEILGNSLFLIGVDNKRPAILKFQYGDPRPQVLRGIAVENNEILSSELVPGRDLIQIITRMKKRKGGNGTLILKQFDEAGNIQKDIRIESTRGYDLIDCKAMTDIDSNTCVVGTYRHESSKLSNGIFTMVHDGDIELPLYYYEYTNLHNYFNYLSSKEKDKMKKKYKKESGRVKNSNYKINQIPREIVRSDDGWIYLGEVVKYTEKNSIVYANMWPMEYRYYSHSLILGVGMDGKLRWDNSFGLDELSSNSDVQQVHINTHHDQSLLFYLNDRNIFYQLIENGQENYTFGTFQLSSSNSVSAIGVHHEKGNIISWYKNKFIVYGSFVTDNTTANGKKIFYMNKISVSANTISN